jgi:nitrous oxidase accessory protein NosD
VLVKDAGGVVIRDNVIADNRVAVHIDDAGRTGDEPARLVRNTLALNQVGILLYPSADAAFSGNAFVENTTQVALGGSGRTQAVWAWHGVGNYWSDYTGFDATGDGIGDVAYERSGRSAQVIARNPMLQALASGPAFRLLFTVEDRWERSDPLVLDEAPSLEMRAPSLTASRSGARVPLWIPGVLLMVGCAWLLIAPRRGQRRVSRA